MLRISLSLSFLSLSSLSSLYLSLFSISLSTVPPPPSPSPHPPPPQVIYDSTAFLEHNLDEGLAPALAHLLAWDFDYFLRDKQHLDPGAKPRGRRGSPSAGASRNVQPEHAAAVPVSDALSWGALELVSAPGWPCAGATVQLRAWPWADAAGDRSVGRPRDHRPGCAELRHADHRHFGVHHHAGTVR